jgi:hypothetical protein
MSGLRNTAWARRNGLSKPTVMTRNGSASDRETGSMGMFRMYADSRATRNANVDEINVAKANH